MNSYHRGFTWTDHQVEGIMGVLAQNLPEMEPLVEYMDWKHFPTAENLQRLYQLYLYKYARQKIEVVICTDNAALEFAAKHQAALFPEAALVFCGINGFQEEMIATCPRATGVVEDVDPVGTIDLALKLQPHTKTVVVISDSTESAQGTNEAIKKAATHFADRVNIRFLVGLSMAEVLEKVEQLPHDSIILMSNLNRDRLGQVYSHEKAISLIRGRSRVPIYGLWSFVLGRGIVGGNLLSGQVQGEYAARFAARILWGEDLRNMPVIRQSPCLPMFDYQQMERFGLKTSLLPPGSLVINQPSSLYQAYKNLIWGGSAVILVLSLLVIVLILNIEKRRWAEKALQESEVRYRSLVQNLPMGVWRAPPGLEGTFLLANPAIAAMFGYASPEEFINTPAPQLCTDPAEHQDLVDTLLTQGKVVGREMQLKRKDGTLFWGSITANMVKNNHGESLFIDGLIEDITLRKLLEDQLAQAQRMEAVGHLAGGVAHDFNNLLTAVIGHSEILLLELPPDEPLSEHVQEIMKAAERGNSLTRQLLAFGRRQILQPWVVNLNSIVTDMNKMLQRLIGEDIDVVPMLDPDLGLVKADPGQIEQIIMNLTLNARDAMPRGGKLTLETANVYLDEDDALTHLKVKPGPYVMLAVSDSGVGMDAETQARIFEPFFTTKERGRGTGLGLSTVYGIVKQSGGHIWLYSEVGKGTIFKIYLPRVEEVFEPSRMRVAPVISSLQGEETILVVEDDDSLRAVISKVLQRYGYDVLTAGNGDEALAVCGSHEGPIHLLLTDVVMPRMSGRELAERLVHLHPETRVLYMSGYTDNAVVHHGVLAADLQFIQKPFKIIALLQKVREVLHTQD
ncbi:MAG: response regulator [Deltaproteobacteria bacterium]|nr:response regulator [Deltaproteobacteria bacterium]MBI4797121.1 response regulator [Deltaproteobacteria bacterium]